MPTEAARDVLHDLTELLPACEVSLINPLIYTNAGALGHAAYRRFLFWVNAARDVVQPPVRIGRYGPHTYIDGSGPFHVLTNETLVTEHLVPGYTALAANHRHMMDRRTRAVDVARPCVLACHPGTQVWSHWLIDTLPKILVAENAYPGRFAFAVPADITDPASPRFLVRSILESLAAYGIAPDRLLRLREGVIYRFDALFDLIDINGDGMHPGVLGALRRLKTPPPFRGRYRVTASMRGRRDIRPVINLPDLAPVLRAHGAAELDPGSTPFLDKVRAFRDSDVIVGDLGSNLATAIYARDGAAIVTVAPSNWRDNYFAQMFQRLGLRHADVRGAPLPQPGDAPGHSPHVVDPLHLDAGLSAAAMPPAPGPHIVDGRPIARAVGAPIFRIDFGASGNARSYQRGHFSAPEATHTWSIGPECAVVVPGFRADGDLWLEIKGIGFIAAPHLVSRLLRVTVNGVKLAEFDIDELTHLHVFVPHAVLARGGDLTIVFHHPICPSPKSMGVSEDGRNLGFMFKFLAIRQKEGSVLF
jgi:hypothetical protein